MAGCSDRRRRGKHFGRGRLSAAANHNANPNDRSPYVNHYFAAYNYHLANDAASDNDHHFSPNHRTAYYDASTNNASTVISCVMTTWRRMHCVERSVSLFCAQTALDNSELLIFNTDVENPVRLSGEFDELPVRVINNAKDLLTGNSYDNIGAVRRDALSHATGEHYICWDDDDIFLPWNNRQCLDGITGSDVWAWKPFSSMWSWNKNGLEIAQNVMEASIIARTDKVRECGYAAHAGGGEHLQWIQAFESAGKLHVNKNSIPAYCFNWSDQPHIGGHKQSGTIDRPDNFEHHKVGCRDAHTRPIERLDVKPIIRRHTQFLESCIGKTFGGHAIDEALFNCYAAPHL